MATYSKVESDCSRIYAYVLNWLLSLFTAIYCQKCVKILKKKQQQQKRRQLPLEIDYYLIYICLAVLFFFAIILIYYFRLTEV